MEFAVGDILPGKVTGINKFGAFVSIGPNRSGLVHISEISPDFVRDVNDFLSVGQEVTVKVIGIDERGRINLSIKQAGAEGAAAPPPRRYGEQRSGTGRGAEGSRRYASPRGTASGTAESRGSDGRQGGGRPESPEEESFEDKLKRFMQDSDSRISGVKQYADMKKSRRRRG
ncbi:MAG: S1 RNA-binding domain-containing protein [Oscillospiraceae bacterium]|nr:S1 RNA-binding domain-containing protein [Oscillospiraceae bacterium]